MLTIPEIIQAAGAHTADEAPVTPMQAAIILRNLYTIKQSASAAIVYWAAHVYEKRYWIDDESTFNDFDDFLLSAIDVKRQYTLYYTAKDFATIIAPWLRENVVINPWTDQRVTPELLIEQAGYAKLGDVKSAIVERKRGQRPKFHEERIEECVALITNPHNNRDDVDSKLKRNGWRVSRNAPPDGMTDLSWATLRGIDGRVTLAVETRNQEQADWIVDQLSSVLCLSQSDPADVFPMPVVLEKEKLPF